MIRSRSSTIPAPARTSGRVAGAPAWPSHGLGIVFTLIGACCWSLGGFFTRSTHGIDAWQIVFYRSWVVLLLMGAVMLGRHRSRVLSVFREAGINAAIAGVALGLAGLTFVLSLFYTTVAQSIFMVGIAPFCSAILGWWILRERAARATWIAMLAALVGLSIMLAGTTLRGFSGSVLALYSAFSFSCYSVLLRWGQRTDMNASIIWNALFLILFSALILLIESPLRTGAGSGNFVIGWWNLAIVLAMGAIQLTLGLALFTLGSKSVPAAELALLALLEPVLAPIWVWLAFGETPSVPTLTGGAVILAALLWRIIADQAAFFRPDRFMRLS
ncbi:MAG: DMT family transporter [Pseudomonadota bacterium]|nr:DMT family transporter [Pseudomonadota bacterium]